MTNRKPLAGPNVWTGAEIKNSKRWIRDMPASAMAELDAALAHVKKKGLDWSQITRADFPINGLDGTTCAGSTSAWARISARRCSRTAAAS
jgi:hypothetical protein